MRGSTFSLCLLIAFGLAGCSKSGTAGTGPGPDTGTPPAISSSAQVVQVTSSPVTIARNASGDAVVKLSIKAGFHINANPATFPYLIATELEPASLNGIKADKPVYPAAAKKKFQFAEQPLAVYEGDAAIKVPLRVSGDAKQGQVSLPIRIRVQACDEEKCYPPATVDSTVTVEVK
jgi:thiol:disulfide interchange protein DsbD